jgi:hypothetical protein
MRLSKIKVSHETTDAINPTLKFINVWNSVFEEKFYTFDFSEHDGASRRYAVKLTKII